ncbi:hypothetical protein TNCV_3420161 [Trichonephila clavipes]|nr:hypothetical protein TNCV_3420161 [Trichonephila clavipes]
MSVDFHDAETRQRPYRMIMWHVKNLLSTYLAWVFSAKLNSEGQFYIVRAQGLELWTPGEKLGIIITCGGWYSNFMVPY